MGGGYNGAPNVCNYTHVLTLYAYAYTVTQRQQRVDKRYKTELREDRNYIKQLCSEMC